MTIKVQIPSVLRSHCDGAAELSVLATNVRETLEHIEQHYPSLYVSVCDETGSLRQHVNLFINSSLVGRDKGLDTTLAPGDVLAIFPAVSGG